MKRDFLRVLPSRKKLQRSANLLTIYGFWIGMALGVVGILLFFDIAKTVIVDRPQDERPVVSDMRVEITWEGNYEPPKETEDALQKLLVGEVYEQPVSVDEWYEFRFPESLDDFPKKSRPPYFGESPMFIYLLWRIGTVPSVPSNKTPIEMRLPLSGDAWEWNIDQQVLAHIRSSEGWNNTEAAWYRIAIAMIGGYSSLGVVGPSAETRMAAVDAFKGVQWTFEAKYKVWNSGEVPTKVANITIGCGPTRIVAPKGIEPDAFIIQPGASNALEFTLIPEAGYKTQEEARNAADCLRENTRLNVPMSKGERVIREPAWAWIGGAVGFGAIVATVMLKVCRFRERRQRSASSRGTALRNDELEKKTNKSH